MSEVDLQSLPPLLTADIQRTLPDGKPTDALSDWEQFQQNWMTTNVVNLDKKLTEVSLHVDGPGGLSGKVTEISSVVQNEDGSLTAGKLTTVVAETHNNTGKISDLSEVVANPDGSITAGRLTSVETTANGASGLISDLTTSVDGIKVQKVLKANLNGATGGYEFAGVQNADGTGAIFSMSFTLNQFQLTDPSYNGGLPGNVFNYSGGYFNFNVPVRVQNENIAGGAVAQFDSGGLTVETAVGLGATTNTLQNFAPLVLTFTMDGKPCMLDVQVNLAYRVVGAGGFPVDLIVYLMFDGSAVALVLNNPGQVNDTGIRNVQYRALIKYAGGALTGSGHQLFLATSYHGSAGGSAAYIEPGTSIGYLIIKGTG